MMVSAAIAHHATPREYSGRIHFRGQFAYLDDLHGWNLLQFASSSLGTPDPVTAAATASHLHNAYQESDPVILQGVLSDQSRDVVAFSVLFLC